MRRRVVIPALIVAVLTPGSDAAAAGWRAPTSGPVTRAFDVGPDPFAAGHHRGADFAAAPGSPVRAACAGRVVVAGRIGSSGGVVTLACGPWRVSHLPLARIDVREGAAIREGDPIGTAGPSRAHAGIHLGVRRATDPFGYVDPLRFIHPRHPAPPAGPAGRERRATRRSPGPATTPRATPATAPRSAPVEAPRAAPIAAPRLAPPGSSPLPLAPWPAWAGLALALLAAAGRGGFRARRGSSRVRGVPGVRTRPLVAARGGAGAGRVRARDDVPP